MLLLAGDMDGYRRWRVQALRRFEDTSDPDIGERVAKTCLVIDTEGREMAAAVAMVNRAVAADPNNRWYRVTKGIAEYRIGQYARALQCLAPTGEREAEATAREAASEFFVAMAHHRLGHTPDAQAALDRAVRLLAKASGPPADPRADLSERNSRSFQDWIVGELARREAKELIGGTPPSTMPVGPRPSRRLWWAD